MRHFYNLMNITETLKDYISQQLLNGTIEVNEDDDLLGNELVDSMGIMLLIGFIEETYNIEIPLEEVTIENFMTITAIDNYISTLTNKSNICV